MLNNRIVLECFNPHIPGILSYSLRYLQHDFPHRRWVRAEHIDEHPNGRCLVQMVRGGLAQRRGDLVDQRFRPLQPFVWVFGLVDYV